MKARLEDKKKAIELRKQGYSYKEIQAQIPVSKGLLSGWLKYLELSEEEIGLLVSKITSRRDKGRITSTISNRNRRIQREIVSFDDAKTKFDMFKEDSFFMVGVTLYWAEGGKRTGEFQFVNSDPEMVVLMCKWIEKYMGFGKDKIKFRLYVHKIPGYENIELFWAHTIGVDPHRFQKTVYKPTIYTTKKNPNYKGCLRISIGGIHHLRIVKAWQKLLIKYYSDK